MYDLDEIFRPGRTVSIASDAETALTAHTADVVALGDVLTVRPSPSLLDLELRVGDPVIVGCGDVVRSMYYRCGSRVVQQATPSTPELHLCRPTDIQKFPRRGYMRAPVSVPCEVLWPTPTGTATCPMPLDCETVNISGGGVLVTVPTASPDVARRCREARSAGLLAGVRLHLPHGPVMDAMARPVRVSGSEAVDPLTMAFAFVDLPEADRLQLEVLALRYVTRVYPRVAVETSCELWVDSPPGHRIAGTTQNLSAGGASVLLPPASAPVDAPACGQLRIELNDQQAVALRFNTLRVSEAQHAGQARLLVAVAFDDVSLADRTAINSFILTRRRTEGPMLEWRPKSNDRDIDRSAPHGEPSPAVGDNRSERSLPKGPR